MNTPLFDALRAQNATGRARFHMPGHKGGGDNLPPELSALFALDTTELPGTGDLYAAEGAVRAAEERASALFGCGDTLFSAGGSTLCLQAMLRAALPHGGKLLCGRVLHRAAAHAFALLDIVPAFVESDGSAGDFFPGRITPAALCAALRAHPDARAVYLTSPDYFGTLSNVGALVQTAQTAGLPLLVDAAHGAHLDFLPTPCGAVSAGADFVAQSAHKTLPALTGAAWLHLRRAADAPAARAAMALFGSSSPSFPILLSLDCARAWLAQAGRGALAALEHRAAQTKALLRTLGFPQPLGQVDPTRIAFTVPDGDRDVGDFLRTQGIEPEYAAQGWVILIPTAANGADDFARLHKALTALADVLPHSYTPMPLLRTPVRRRTPREAFLAQTHPVPTAQTVGKIAAWDVIPCPPAVPLVLAGEEIDAQTHSALQRYGVGEVWVLEE
ncbi:MAG: amino acid decarboxylase [Oscillospiraceae bacterium]|jgi:arginine/lysine/ornithine decarboxylase|nr:amino acid decarboxylase [Oscillospiraceae bacterium]